ncbi:MAG: YbjN domain-containing protein [Bauldia sp.]
MSLTAFDEAARNPVDRIELIAGENDWAFERSGSDEITVSVVGEMAEYHVSFSWMPDVEAIHLAASFDLRVTAVREVEIMRLLALINAQLIAGHFDFWADAGVLMYRHSASLIGGRGPTDAEIETMLAMATSACDRYYEAFQFVVWAGKSARESLQSVLFETIGEA